MVKRGWRAVYAPDARATEKMVPTIEGEWRRKRRMMSHAWPIVLRGGLLSPRGYDPLYALMIASHRLLRYASPALHVAIVAARARRSRAARSSAPRSPPTRRCWRRRWPAARAARAAAAAGALLRAHHRLARRRALRPPAPRHAGGLGRARRARGEPPGYARQARARRRARGGRRCCCSASAARRSRRCSSGSRPTGTRSTASAASAATAQPFELYKLRTMVTGAERMGAGLVVDEGDARITRIGAVAAPLLDRRAAEPRSTCCAGEMSLVGPRPTVQVQVDRYTERQRGRLSRAARASPAGRRSTAARRCRGTSGSSSTSGTSSTPRCALDLRILWRTPADGVHRPRALPRRDGRLARAARSDVLGDPLRALVDVARAERPDRVEHLVVHLRAGERVRPRRGGDLRRPCRSCSRTAACGSRRASRRAAPRACATVFGVVPGLYWISMRPCSSGCTSLPRFGVSPGA